MARRASAPSQAGLLLEIVSGQETEGLDVLFAGAVDDKGKRTPLDVQAGDTILFGKYSGQEIKLDGEEFLIMREDEVLGVIEG